MKVRDLFQNCTEEETASNIFDSELTLCNMNATDSAADAMQAGKLLDVDNIEFITDDDGDLVLVLNYEGEESEG